MRAYITMRLEHPTWGGSRFSHMTLVGKKDEIISMVQDFILDRVNKPSNWIRVENFHVEVKDMRGREVSEWNYAPTYR